MSPAGLFSSKTENFTGLFERARLGDGFAANLVYGLAMPRLRHIAAGLLSRHRSHNTLQPTALVNELCLKLRCFEVRILGREHFFHLSARAMNQVLMDRGRSQTVRKAKTVEMLEELRRNHACLDSESAGVVRAMLERFARIDRRAADIVRLHYMEGYTWDEISQSLGYEVWRVRDDASFALGWMRDHLS